MNFAPNQPALAKYRRREQPDIVEMAQRITVPITVHLATDEEITYEPGDWLVVRERPVQHFSLCRHSQFLAEYDPMDMFSAEVMQRDDFDLVVNEHRPAISLEQMHVDRNYFVCMRRRSPILPSECWRGYLVLSPDPAIITLKFADSAGSVDLVRADIAYVVPLNPETEPCLLS